MTETADTKKRIIIIGGGFAGLPFIQHLDTNYFSVLLIDKLNHHQFQPLFYQVATSQLEPSSISFPFRKVFQHKKNMQVRMAEVSEINSGTNKVITNIGNFQYDFLVIASGCKTNFFGNDELMKKALPLKTIYDAITIRNQILENFEKFLSVPEHEKECLLNIVIAGAGPTGIELAGAFAEIKKNILPKDYPGIDFTKLNIILVEGSKYPLSSMSGNAQKFSAKYLDQLGVKLLTEVFVNNYDGNEASLSNGQKIKTKNLIWTAGVTGNIINGLGPESITRGRINVNRFNLVEDYPDIYAIGDIAFMHTPKYPSGHPQVANVAIGQAKNLARNFNAMIKNKSWKEYEYTDLGSMATIGKNKAVVDFPFMKLKGRLAWFIWMSLHLMLILSVKNKLIIFINWAWSYLTKDTSLRLILKKTNN
ncbi:MAG: NAD(P)/FAD-dependent oxidoreductase [Bacteroidia bacterium]